MEDKPLIGGSICAVVLLVLGSLSTVVGYQSVKSTRVSDSPLFSIRTNTATKDENNKGITTDYLGKGVNALSFPLRDTNVELIQKFITRIRTMDDDTFNRFVDYALIQIRYRDNLKNTNIPQFMKEVNILRTQTENIILAHEVRNNNRTVFFNYDPTVCWFPGCTVIKIFYVLFMTIIVMMMFLDAVQSVLVSFCFCP